MSNLLHCWSHNVEFTNPTITAATSQRFLKDILRVQVYTARHKCTQLITSVHSSFGGFLGGDAPYKLTIYLFILLTDFITFNFCLAGYFFPEISQVM